MAQACVVCGEPNVVDRCRQCGAACAPGGYVVRRVVAQTTHSRLYEATDAEGQRVAVKELVFALVPDAQQLEAFHREVAVLRQLDVPGVPRFLSSFEEGRGVGTRLYLVQEFVDGTSLAARLREGPMPEAGVVAVARSVLGILAQLHEHEPMVLHRDVKPSNLIEREDGSIVLVDFGAARVLHDETTFRSTLVGTYGYMPPEQLAGAVDATSDLYALGATLVHLLTGKAPAELLGDRLSLELTAQTVPSKPLRRWLSRLLDPARGKRFRSARDARAAFEALDAPGAAVPAWSSVSPKQLLAAGGLFAVAAAVSLGVLHSFNDGPQPIEPRRLRQVVPRAVPVVASATVPEEREVEPPLEVVSLERVLPAGKRAAFWLETGFTMTVPGRSWAYWSRRTNAALTKPCAEDPAAFVDQVTVTLDPRATSGARLALRLGSRYGTDGQDCVSVPARLVSDEDGEVIPPVDGTSHDHQWIVSRTLERLTLLLGGTEPVAVAIDLRARTIQLPRRR